MNFRPKTLRRLTILLISACAFIAAASVVVVSQLHRYERRQQAIRAVGMAAYHRGDYRKATANLSKYLSNDRIDSEAIFASAVSRTKLSRPDLSNLLDARGQFNRYLELNPHDVTAQHQLLEIYQKLHYASETVSLADELLAANPNDVPALSAKLGQLVRDLKFTAALPVSLRLNDLVPDDLRLQETTYFLMSRIGRPPGELIARADGMVNAHPRDARYEMLRAVAAYFSSDISGAKQWLLTAAKSTPIDADFTLMMVTDFDRLDMGDNALDLLKRAGSGPHATVAIRAALIQRLWEFKQYDSALAELSDLNAAALDSDSRLIGLHALVLHDSAPNSPGFLRDLKILQSRNDDMVATGWALLLAVESQNFTGDNLARLQQYVAAEHADPDNPNIRFYLGRQYDRLGESELALQCFRQVVQMQPEWPDPPAEIARIMKTRSYPTTSTITSPMVPP